MWTNCIYLLWFTEPGLIPNVNSIKKFGYFYMGKGPQHLFNLAYRTAKKCDCIMTPPSVDGKVYVRYR